MPKSVNKVILLGNLGRDPEFKMTPSGTPVVTFSIATSERYKSKTGEWQDRTEWHNCKAWMKTAEIIRDYVKKGSKVYVEGRLETQSWDDKDSGKKVYRTEIVVEELVMLSSKDGASGSSRPVAGEEFSNAGGYSSSEIEDSDIPF